MAEGEPNAAASLEQAATLEGLISASNVPKVDQQLEPVTGSTGLGQSPTTATTNTTNKNTMASVSAPVGDGHGGATDTNTNTDTDTSIAPVPVQEPAPVPLDSPLRTTPIHPSLPSIKMPAAPDTSSDKTSVGGAAESNNSNTLNPITLRPFSGSELEKYGFEKLKEEIKTNGLTTTTTTGGTKEERRKEIERLQNETAALIKQKLEERETKTREIEREMEEKEKTREVERKVFMKKLSSAGTGTGAGVGGKDI